MVLTYDEWGGFFDHVDPPQVPDDRATPADPGGDEDFGQLGFRVPSTILSPWTRNRAAQPGLVDHNTYEHTSILKFISDNWGLPYLTARHRHASSIASAFGGFARRDLDPAFVPYDAPLHLAVEPTLEMAGIDPSPVYGAIAKVGNAAPLSAPPVPGSDLHRLAETGWFDRFRIRTDWRFEDSYLHSRPELLAAAAAAATYAAR
jgi:phospholipase C